MTAKEWLLSTDKEIEESVSNGYDIRLDEYQLLKKMESYHQAKLKLLGTPFFAKQSEQLSELKCPPSDMCKIICEESAMVSNSKKGSEFEDWLKKQHLREVITREYTWKGFILDEEFVLAKFNEDKKLNKKNGNI
jgi:hypothetical protein